MVAFPERIVNELSVGCEYLGKAYAIERIGIKGENLRHLYGKAKHLAVKCEVIKEVEASRWKRLKNPINTL